MKCFECGAETRFDKKKNIHKKYCVLHANLARKEWSKNNGFGAKQEAGWKKGLTKETHAGIKSQSDKISGEGNPWYNKSLPEETIKKATRARVQKLTLSEDVYNKQTTELTNFKVLTEYKDYYNNYKQLLDVECVQCGQHQKKSLWMLKNNTVCRSCTPYSSEERTVGDFIESLGFNIERNSRKIIAPSEIDITVPDLKIGFEYNGLYWHSEQYKVKEHHLNKTKACMAKNFNLIHIFSDDWNKRQEIVKSMIRNQLGKIENKIYARNCIVKEITNKQAKEFFDDNHLSGHTKSKIYFGLFYKDSLASAISLRIPRHKIYQGKIEIGRFASLINNIVVGGFSKLLKECINWCKKNKISEIITYADLSHGDGSVYSKNGFSYVKDTPLNYWYTDGEVRFDRLSFRAKGGLSESQIAQKSGVHRIYGCGSSLFKLVV